jgi:hypothetical protein
MKTLLKKKKPGMKFHHTSHPSDTHQQQITKAVQAKWLEWLTKPPPEPDGIWNSEMNQLTTLLTSIIMPLALPCFAAGLIRVARARPPLSNPTTYKRLNSMPDSGQISHSSVGVKAVWIILRTDPIRSESEFWGYGEELLTFVRIRIIRIRLSADTE